MSSPIYQNVIDLVVCLSIRRGPGVFMDAAMGEHGAFDDHSLKCSSNPRQTVVVTPLKWAEVVVLVRWTVTRAYFATDCE
jgi:hypothetical protein